MAGHSKWSKVKHIKGSLDQKRGQLFGMLATEITVAARLGGGDPSRNHYLRSAIRAALALIFEMARENRIRTVADLRLILTKVHGNLALPGAGSYTFYREGRVTVPAAAIQEERLLDLVIEAGGEELTQEDGHYVIPTAPDKLCTVAEALRSVGIQSESQKLTFVSETSLMVTDPAVATRVERLIGMLEDSDDVRHLHRNPARTEEAVAPFSI
ncbi:MAG TPA: YebC/PmpR family DNA-binding transcriptional regulator [Chthoniobacter sp.]|nr:YebC/PmpR family DNA-binding transcriptional regulator [Chthoniobacter sp.]